MATRATGTTKVTVHTTIILTVNQVTSIFCITSLSAGLIIKINEARNFTDHPHLTG